jgi:hypothetical protein
VIRAFRNPGALPQASDDIAPLALNKHMIPAGFAKENACRSQELAIPRLLSAEGAS